MPVIMQKRKKPVRGEGNGGGFSDKILKAVQSGKKKRELLIEQFTCKKVFFRLLKKREK